MNEDETIVWMVPIDQKMLPIQVTKSQAKQINKTQSIPHFVNHMLYYPEFNGILDSNALRRLGECQKMLQEKLWIKNGGPFQNENEFRTIYRPVSEAEAKMISAYRSEELTKLKSESTL